MQTLCMRTYPYAYTYTYFMHACIYMDIHAYLYKCIKDTQVCTRTYIHTYMHTYIYISTYMDA